MTVHRITHSHPDLDVEHDQLVASHCCRVAEQVRDAVARREVAFEQAARAARQGAFDVAADRLHAEMSIAR